MRLSIQEQNAIISCFHQSFGEMDHLWLFGSRIDESKRGGDIDLYIETNLTAEEAVNAQFRFLREVKEIIEDQKIDIVLNVLVLGDDQSIYTIAKKGIQLV